MPLDIRGVISLKDVQNGFVVRFRNHGHSNDSAACFWRTIVNDMINRLIGSD